MVTLIHQIRLNIELTKSSISKLQDDIDNTKPILDFTDEAQVIIYEDLKENLNNERRKLLHLRSALVSVYYANGVFDINTFYPELYV